MKKPAYSAALDRVLFRASRLARELGGAQTGTEHLLLALSQERISQPDAFYAIREPRAGSCAVCC